MNVDVSAAPTGGEGLQSSTTNSSVGVGVGAVMIPNATIPDLPRAAELLFGNTTSDKKLYWDRSHYDSPESQMKALEKSSTLYIGNMAFSTRSLQLKSHFAQVGPVKAVHMGLDRFRKTPCGFAFVEYHRRRDALEAVASLTGTKLDGRVIRVELDAGYKVGREMGRGTSGGQVRDDRRKGPLDAGRIQKQQFSAAGNNQAGAGPYGPNRNNNNNNNDNNGEKDMGFTNVDDMEKNPRFREE